MILKFDRCWINWSTFYGKWEVLNFSSVPILASAVSLIFEVNKLLVGRSGELMNY